MAALVLSSGLLRRVRTAEEALFSSQPPRSALFCVISGSHCCAQHSGEDGWWEKLVPGLFLWADSGRTPGSVPAPQLRLKAEGAPAAQP